MDIFSTIYDSLKFNYELIVLSITLIVLWWTGRAVWSTYWLHATPNLSFTLEPVDQNKSPHYYFVLFNDSRKDVKALVNTKIYIDDPENPIPLKDPYYTGERSWTIPAGHRIRGHKDFAPFLITESNNQPIRFTIEMNICYREWSRLKRCTIGDVYTVPTYKWNYSERGLIPVITDDEMPDFNCPGG